MNRTAMIALLAGLGVVASPVAAKMRHHHSRTAAMAPGATSGAQSTKRLNEQQLAQLSNMPSSGSAMSVGQNPGDSTMGAMGSTGSATTSTSARPMSPDANATSGATTSGAGNSTMGGSSSSGSTMGTPGQIPASPNDPAPPSQDNTSPPKH
jgi:hypothetical protein